MTKEEYINKKLELYRKITHIDEFNMEYGTNNKLCKRCGGSCCKNYPCSFSPYDFIDINNFDYMKRILDTGYFVIDFFTDKEKNIFYIRTRGLQDDGIVINHRSLENECVLHKNNKCELDYYSRPTGGALLIPSRRDLGLPFCYNYYTYKVQLDDWSKFQDIMHEIVSYYQGKNINVPKVSKIRKLEKIIRKDEI